uniref:UBX domain-containing protein 6 isoform X2 n=1 Tax=Panthera onca TaxID=9690 RepID=UPI0029552F94|nr:UBX domain-containing protein 6 isoform X2 [Panthera onca]
MRERAPRGKPNQPALQQPRQGPTDEAQMAAAAALARLEQKQPRARGPTSQESIRNQVRKELRAEATVSGSPEAPGTNRVPEPREEGSTHLAVPAVCFTCPLTGATLRKDQRDAHIKEAILSVSGSPVSPPSTALPPRGPGARAGRAGWHGPSVSSAPACIAFASVSLQRQAFRGVRSSGYRRVGREKPPLGHPSWRRPL